MKMLLGYSHVQESKRTADPVVRVNLVVTGSKSKDFEVFHRAGPHECTATEVNANLDISVDHMHVQLKRCQP